MALELFQWDSKNRNAFSLALRLIHGIIKEILACRQFSDALKISSSIQFLEFSEVLLDMVYSWKRSSKSVDSKGHLEDRFSPTKTIASDPKGGKECDGIESSSVGDNSEGFSRQRSQVTSSLSAPWLLLYNYTAQSCKRFSKQRKEVDDEVDGSHSQDTLKQLLCDVQKKLQDAGVAIPSTGPGKHASAVASFVERNQDDTAVVSAGLPLLDSPSDSLFGRKRANRGNQTPKQSTPTRLRKAGSLDRLLDASSIGKSPQHRRDMTNNTPDALSSANLNDKTAETLLAILYVNLQQYNLRSALELVFSLMEPPLEHFDSSLSSLFTPIIENFRASGGQDYATSQVLSILLQTYPILRVADKCGLPAVQTLGRFMAAYFSNLPLYIFPSYHPEALPPFYMVEPNKLESTSDESFAWSQGVEVLHLDRDKVSSAVRDQGISDIWSANNALEFMLVSGLIGEAAWLTNNLGDWKHALLLSVAHTNISKYSQPEKLSPTLFPSLPDDITPERVVLVRLQPIFHSSQSTLPIIQKIPIELEEDATSTPKKDRIMVEEPNPGKLELEIDDKLVKDVGKMLQASVVAGLDIVPILTWKMLHDLLGLVSQMEWIVPEELYLPAPPLFCPQPPSAEKEFLLPRVYRERQLRSEVAQLVQKLLTLFHSSNCMAACIQWYVQELIAVNEKWYGIPKDDQDFIFPQSLVSHSEMTSTFAAAEESLIKTLKRSSPKTKGKRSPPRSSTIHSSSVSVVLACFQQFCFVMWMLHARDKMSLCARKYRRARNETETNPQTADLIDGLCWETLRWTLELQPFSSFLGASSQVADALLTLLSEMQPSIATAEITAQHFPDPNLIPSTSGRAKFKRLMTQFRGITLREAGSIEEENSDEPLSIFYRMKCLEWEDELKERARLYSNVQVEVFPRVNTEEELPSIKAKDQISFITSKNPPNVGATIFETSQSYVDFLDTFFVITFTKTASQSSGQVTTDSVPLLLPYEKLFIFSENKALKEFQVKARVDKRKNFPMGTSLYRSQSYSDVRSNRLGIKHFHGRDESGRVGQTDVRRCNSLNDVSKATSNSGIVVLGNEIMEILPNLVWLSRWSSEGSFLPSSSNIDKAAILANDVLPVMKVHVELPMLVNSLWLLKNIYGPWEINEYVNPEFLKHVPKPVDQPSSVEQECLEQQRALPIQDFTADWPTGTLLRRASSDTDIPRIMVQSPTTEEESHGRKEERGFRNGRSKHENRTEAATSTRSDTVASPMQDSTQSKEKRSRKKSKSAKRHLNLDVEEEDTRDGGIPLEKASDIRDDPEIPKNIKPNVKAKRDKQVSSTNKTRDHVIDEQISSLRHDRRDTSPATSTNHGADTARHSLQEAPPSEQVFHSTPSIPGPNVQDVVTNEQQMIDRSRNVLPGNSAVQALNGGMELLLVLRPPNAGNQSSSASNVAHVPLLKLSTMTSDPPNVSSSERAVSIKTRIKETASQTEPQTNTSISADAGRFDQLNDHSEKGFSSKAVDFSAQYDECRDVSCQTAFSPNPSQVINQGTSRDVVKEPVYNQIPLNFNNGQKHPPRFAWPQQNDPTNFNIPFPLLRMNEKPNSGDESCSSNPMKMFRGYPQGESTEENPSFPLLRIPKQAPLHQSNARTFRLFQVPCESRNLPLLHFPTNQDKNQNKPDLSKIKFLELSRNNDPLMLLKKGESSQAGGAGSLLLHMPEKQSRSSVFRNLPTGDALKKDTPMTLLRMPEKKPNPTLVPADKLAVFEKKRKRKKESFRYSTLEKENIKPKRKQEKRYKADREKDDQTRDLRQTMSRQRRREQMREDEEEREKVKSKQVLVKSVQRAKPSKANKNTEKASDASGVILEDGLSGESDLELSDISENFDLSEEEQLYFNVHSTPTVTNPQVDQYCKELETRVRKQFDKELEQRMKEEMEREVKEQVKKEMEKKREEEEVRKRVREELALQERIEQQARLREELALKEQSERETRAREEELASKHEVRDTRHEHTKLEEIKENDRPVPRKRSTKHEKGINVHFEEDGLRKTRSKQQNSVEIQVEDDDFSRSKSNQGNQTEPVMENNEGTTASDKPKSFAPVLPPDIFMGLTFPRDQGQDTDPDGDDMNVPYGNTSEPLKDKDGANQFISVADIDSKLWEKVKDSAMATRKHEKEENHVVDDTDEIDFGEEQQTDNEERSDRQSPERLDKQPLQYDSLTVHLMDSIDTPRQRMNTVRSVSKERISNRLEEMGQQLEVIEQITQNMDREFKSSNVLLNAIESIGDIMTPPVKESSGFAKRAPSSKRYDTPARSYERMQGNAPWRREKDAPVYRKEDTPSSPTNVSVDGIPDEADLDKRDDVPTKEGKVSFKDESEDDGKEEDLSVENDTLKRAEDRESIDENLDDTTAQGQSHDLEKSRDSVESRQTSTEDRFSDLASSKASRRSNSGSFKEMPKLSSETLKEIFSDSRDSWRRRERNNQRSLEKRKKIQDWMAKKRTERHAAWKTEVENLRSCEFKPFTTATEGPSSLKKMKLAERERETKRRKRENVSTEERMKAASSLLSEMLAEPIPKADTLRNIRHAPPTPKEKTKSKYNDRYNKKPKSFRMPSKSRTLSDVTRPDKADRRDPTLAMNDVRKDRLSSRGFVETPYTSSPIYPNMDIEYDDTDVANRYGIGLREEARSVTPSGADFITMKTYRMHEKEKLRRSKELEMEKQLNIPQTDTYEQPRMDFTGLYRSGSSIDIDNLMDQIPEGSTMDDDRLQDIQSLLSDDSELKELLSDVIGSNAKFDRNKGILTSSSKKADVTRPVGMGTVTLNKVTRKETEKTNTGSSDRTSVKTRPALQAAQLRGRPVTAGSNKPRSKVATASNKTGAGRGRPGSLGNRAANPPEVAGRSDSARGRGKSMGKEAPKELEKPSKDLKKQLVDIDDVSPWNTGDSLNMSDDIAQLLAEAKQAIGDDVSESSGSIMSNIDWDAVDKIMNDL